VPTDGHTDWQTNTNRFHNLSHAICYSYGTDKKVLLMGQYIWYVKVCDNLCWFCSKALRSVNMSFTRYNWDKTWHDIITNKWVLMKYAVNICLHLLPALLLLGQHLNWWKRCQWNAFSLLQPQQRINIIWMFDN